MPCELPSEQTHLHISKQCEEVKLLGWVDRDLYYMYVYLVLKMHFHFSVVNEMDCESAHILVIECSNYIVLSAYSMLALVAI